MAAKITPPPLEYLRKVILTAKNHSEAARQLGVSTSTVGKWKKEFHIVHDNNDGKICKACGEKFPATVDYFQPNGTDNQGKPRLRAKCKPCENARKRANVAVLSQNTEWVDKRRDYDASKKREYRRNGTPYAERQKELNRQWYHHMVSSDLEWVEKEKTRKKELARWKWENDPVFRHNEAIRAKVYRINNPEKIAELERKHAELKKIRRQTDDEYREKMNDYRRIYHSKRIQEPSYRAKHRMKLIRYEKRLQNATPSWLTEAHWEDIRDIYFEVQELNENYADDGNTNYEVDHYFPIYAQDQKGKHIGCGLHVPWNLRIVERAVNRSRGSRVFDRGKIIK